MVVREKGEIVMNNRWIAFGICVLLATVPVVAGLVVIVLAIACFVWWPNQKWQLMNCVYQLQEENGELEEKIQELESQLAATRKKNRQLAQALDTERIEKEAVVMQVGELEQQVNQLEEVAGLVSEVRSILVPGNLFSAGNREGVGNNG